MKRLRRPKDAFVRGIALEALIGPFQADIIRELRTSGFFGDTHNEVVEHLLRIAIDRLIDAETVQKTRRAMEELRSAARDRAAGR